MIDLSQQRREMVSTQLERRGIRDPHVLRAMDTVPRERFVPDRYRPYAYCDSPLPIEHGQTISQPYIVAAMIEAMQLEPGDRVLEVGTGSGYAAAVIAEIAHEVYTIERYPALADVARRRLADAGYTNVHVRCGDGTLGWPEHAPFDAITVAAGGPHVPTALQEQLSPGGRLVIPVGPSPHLQELIRLTRQPDGSLSRETLCDVRFVPLVGEDGWDTTTRGETPYD